MLELLLFYRRSHWSLHNYMADSHKNFAYSTIATAPSPADSGTSLVVATGNGTLFPTPPFNATIWPASTQPTSSNSEIVRVTAISTDTFTITRSQEGTTFRNVLISDQIAATITAQSLTDVENIASTWSPFQIGSGAATGLQTLANSTGQSGTGSLFVFPVTVPKHIRFNQIIVLNSISFVTSTDTVSNSYYSLFGLYSMNANTLSLISSSSFSIGETLRSSSATWNYPTTTMTSGYGYGSFPSGNLTATVQLSSYLLGPRAVGLQFGGNMALTPNIYYLGLLSLRSTGSVSTFGLSHLGIVGQPINPMNAVGSVSGLNPIGSAASNWGTGNTHSSQWWGRFIVGFITNTTRVGFAGNAIPPSITLSELANTQTALTGTILPTVTFVST